MVNSFYHSMSNIFLFNKHKTVEFFINFLVAVFFMVVTYRIIFYNFSFLSQVILFVIFFLGYKSILVNIQSSSQQTKWLLFINFIFSTFLILYSLFVGENESSLIFRFYFITNLLVLAYFYPVTTKIMNIFLIIVFFQALFVIGFEIFMILNFDSSNYGVIRFYIIETGIGDVYTYDGKFWKIQLSGNHLLPLALFISMVIFTGKKRLFLITIFLISSIFSGHFAFLLAIGFFIIGFFVINMRMTYNNIVKYVLVVFFLGLIVYQPLSSYVSNTMEKKSEGSLSTRGDQANVLIEDMTKTPYEFFLGKGFGNTADIVSNSRDYRNAIYYELQALYMFNQWGIVYGVFFILLNVYLIGLKMYNKNLIFIYLSFLLYALTNPYVFDSVHIILTLVFLSLYQAIQEQKLKNLREIYD